MKFYRGLPLFAKIVIGAILGVFLGLAIGRDAGLKVVSDLVLQFLRLLATPLILFSVLHSLLTAEVRGRTAGKLMWVLFSNTLIAVLIGMVVATVLAPGTHVSLQPPAEGFAKRPVDPAADLLAHVPKDFVGPFAGNDLIGVILVGLAAGLALRSLQNSEHSGRIQSLIGAIKLGLDVTLKMLHWVFELVPLAVMAIVAHVVGTTGFAPFLTMVWFTSSVVVALVLMAGVYSLRLRLSSRVRPVQFWKGGFDAFALAFSTASSAATLPVTYACATEKLGIKEESASLGIMVGGAFNHDGSALYQAMSALFVAQAVGMHLSFSHHLLIIVMAIIASVASAGIPESGLVTMIAVFSAVGLPIGYIPLLLPLDWFLDRCRTTINVAGDLASTCIIDNRPRDLTPNG